MPYDPEETRKLFEMLEEYLTPEEKEELLSPRKQSKDEEGEQPSKAQALASARASIEQPNSRTVSKPNTTPKTGETASRRSTQASATAQKSGEPMPRRPTSTQTTSAPKQGELVPNRPVSAQPPATPKSTALAPRRPTSPQPTVQQNTSMAPKAQELSQKRPVEFEMYDNNVLPMRPASGRGRDKIVMYDVEIEDDSKLKSDGAENERSAAAGSGERDGKKTGEKSGRKSSGNGDGELKVDIGDENTKLKYDFEKNYKDIRERGPLRPRREKRTGIIGGILYAAFVLCVSLVLGSLIWMATADVLGFASADEQVNITIQAGYAMDDIIDMIYDAQLIKYKSLFRIYAEYSKAEEKITAGSYVLNKNLDYRSIVYAMTARGGARREQTVPIPEGFSLADIFSRMEEYDICSADALWEAATNHDFKYSFLDSATLGQKYRLEGFLFPDTYNFYVDSSAESVITKLLNEFKSKFSETYIERAEFMGYTISEIITIASMIEREAGNDEERPRIAAVIYNRLNSNDFPMLQIDATIHYAIAGTGIPFSTEFDSPYNTYMYDGLPPGPIANPGLASIRAALYPDSTNEYFYALSKTGAHEFFRTLREHEAFVASDEYDG